MISSVDIAKKKVLFAFEHFNIAEFCDVTGKDKHFMGSKKCNILNQKRPIGLETISLCAEVLGLNIAEMFVPEEDVFKNYERYEGAELKYYGYNVNRIMNEKGLRKKDLVNKGLQQQYVYNICNGNFKVPKLGTLDQLRKALDVEWPELFLAPKEDEIDEQRRVTECGRTVCVP